MPVDKFNRSIFKVTLPKKQYLKYDGKHFYCGDNMINVALNKNLLRINYNNFASLEYNGKPFKPKHLIFFNPGQSKHQFIVKNKMLIIEKI